MISKKRDSVSCFVVLSNLKHFLVAVGEHNKKDGVDKIESVLCPGLGTAVGRMPYERCAYQMKVAYEACILRKVDIITNPQDLGEPWEHHSLMAGLLCSTM